MWSYTSEWIYTDPCRTPFFRCRFWQDGKPRTDDTFHEREVSTDEADMGPELVYEVVRGRTARAREGKMLEWYKLRAAIIAAKAIGIRGITWAIPEPS